MGVRRWCRVARPAERAGAAELPADRLDIRSPQSRPGRDPAGHCRHEWLYWHTCSPVPLMYCSTENRFSGKDDFSLYDLETSYA